MKAGTAIIFVSYQIKTLFGKVRLNKGVSTFYKEFSPRISWTKWKLCGNQHFSSLNLYISRTSRCKKGQSVLLTSIYLWFLRYQSNFNNKITDAMRMVLKWLVAASSESSTSSPVPILAIGVGDEKTEKLTKHNFIYLDENKAHHPNNLLVNWQIWSLETIVIQKYCWIKKKK